MNPHEHDHLPPELRGVARHLRAPHVTPSDEALDAAMSRAQRVRPDGRRGRFLRASGPRMSGRMRAIAVTAALGLVGMTGAAVVVNSSGSGGPDLPVIKDAALAQYMPPPDGGCPGDELLLVDLDAVNGLLVTLDPIRDATLILFLRAQILIGEFPITICADI